MGALVLETEPGFRTSGPGPGFMAQCSLSQSSGGRRAGPSVLSHPECEHYLLCELLGLVPMPGGHGLWPCVAREKV